MSFTSPKEQLPFVGFLTPKREQTDRLPSIARRYTGSSEADRNVDLISLEQRDSTGAIYSVVIEPGTPDSHLLSSRTPDSGNPASGTQYQYSSSSGGEQGFETPARKLHPGRTFLQERMIGDLFDSPSSAADLSALGTDFLSPERDWGKRGRPRADEITSLIMEGSQSGSNIKCHICSRSGISE